MGLIASEAEPQEDRQKSLLDRYLEVRRQTLALCAPLEVEDYQIQPMDDASPPKWHLAHVSWFFETFILKRQVPSYQDFHPAYKMLFNSYYNGVGELWPRHARGLLSRPTLEEVFAYGRHVDQHMSVLLSTRTTPELRFMVELGINHEQQHQELLLTDMKYNLGNNPLKPVYLRPALNNALKHAPAPSALSELRFIEFGGGEFEVGAEAIGVNTDAGFAFDNEAPRHRVLLPDFALANRPVTNGEYQEFIEDGGYERAELWLSDAWDYCRVDERGRHQKCWTSPLYWSRREDGKYWEYTLRGEREIDPNQPVCHVSAYEADAYARWRDCRLPTEFEWERGAAGISLEGNFVETGAYHPGAFVATTVDVTAATADANADVAKKAPGLERMFGDVWEWTSSSYTAYPGFKSFAGQLGEYNGKFMANQLVLRGGSCATPQAHIRATYRNFFYPRDRWQFSGIRLATDPGHV